MIDLIGFFIMKNKHTNVISIINILVNIFADNYSKNLQLVEGMLTPC